MATGDIKWFAQGLLDLGNKIHNLSSDTLKLGLTIGTTTPAVTTTGPHWAGTGTTNFGAEQVATGTSYATGGPSLTTVTWSIVSGVPTLRADIVTIAQDATGFTNARWGILYNSTDVNKRALAYVDLGASRSVQGGALTIDWSGATNDILTITQA